MNRNIIFNLFLSHFGYLDGSKIQDLISLPFDSNSTVNLEEEIKRIDQLKEYIELIMFRRESCNVTVLFCNDETETLKEIFSAKNLNPHYQRFVESLGWIVNYSSDSSCSSLNMGNSSQRLYWATPTEEITLHIPYEIDTQNIGCTCPIYLIWYQSSSHSYECLLQQIFADKKILVCLFIIPLKDGSDLNRICIEVKKIYPLETYFRIVALSYIILWCLVDRLLP